MCILNHSTAIVGLDASSLFVFLDYVSIEFTDQDQSILRTTIVVQTWSSKLAMSTLHGCL